MKDNSNDIESGLIDQLVYLEPELLQEMSRYVNRHSLPLWARCRMDGIRLHLGSRMSRMAEKAGDIDQIPRWRLDEMVFEATRIFEKEYITNE